MVISAESYLDPRHVVLLHFLHLQLHRRVELVLELQRLHVIHVAIVVVQVSGGKEVD